MNMKTVVLGTLLIIILGIGGLVYRNAVEHPTRPIACPLDAKVCPDGTTIGRSGLSCSFPACPPPNVSLDQIGLAFALPQDFAAVSETDVVIVASYQAPEGAGHGPLSIGIRQYALSASSTALAIIQSTAISGTSGKSVPTTAYSSVTIGGHRFTVVPIERFEGVVHTAYYLTRAGDVLRFDAIDHDAMGWTDPTLDVSTLPAQAALRAMLSTLQAE